MMSNNDEMFDLVAAYAVDALEPQERLRAEAALRHRPELRAELDEHRMVLAILAEAVDPLPSTPSRHVWDGIMHSIDGTDEVLPPLASVRDLRTQQRLTKWTAALSIAAVAFVLLLGVSVLNLRQQAEPTINVAIQELLGDPTATLATLTAADDGLGDARIVLGRDGIGYIFADTLPELDPERTYQLWAIVEDRVISAGVLGTDPDDSPFQVVGNVTGFAITDEVAGGVPVSEGATVAVWLRDA